MKTHLQKLMATVVLGLALLLNSLPAWAGLALPAEVHITSNSALGSLTGARYSADSEQWIGCDTHSASTAQGVYQSVYCFAWDKTGKSLYCFSDDPRFVDAVKGMTDSSFISFASKQRPVGHPLCTDLTIENASTWLK